jgi:multicomponent Na+:H+ antiporter subunit E
MINWHTPLTLAALAGLWWLLSDGDPASWIIGLPAVAAAGWSAHRLRSGGASTISASGLLRFLPFFLWESLRGGIDVALRTLAPRMRIHPGFTVYRTRLRRRDARVLFANCVSLLPGTLAADVDGDRLDVHLLDAGSDPAEELRRLELAVARVYPDIS